MKRHHEESEGEITEDVYEDGAAAGATNGTDRPILKKRHKAKQKDSSHDFSVKEISRLQESETVFHSSLFRLQITELLKEVNLKQKLKHRVQGALELLTELIHGFSSGKEHKIVDRKWLQSSGIKVPVVENPATVKGTFKFQPPVAVKVVGSYALNTVVKPNVEASLALLIPKDFFQTKDYLNQRCVRKQALYLAFIASHLRKKKKVEGLLFSYQEENPLKPRLIVTVKGKDSKAVKIRLHAVPEKDAFKLSRFEVTKNNIRPKWFMEKSLSTEEDETDPSSLPPTPIYNMSVASDVCLIANHDFVEKSMASSEGLRQGIVLLTIWLQQRQLSEGWGCFTSELMTYYVIYLLMKKKLNKLMNSYQVFRSTLLNLSRADWQSEPPSLCEEMDSSRLAAFRTAFPCVFVDRTGHVNLAYTVSKSLYIRVKEEARLSISALEQCHHRSFDTLFMIPMSFPRTFDYIFHVAVCPELLDSAFEKAEKLKTSSLDLGGQQSLALQMYIEDLLSKALDTRAMLVQAIPCQSKTWQVSDDPYNYDMEKHLTFGVRLNSLGAFNVLNKGPAADSHEAKEFRDFWGEKAEMRRFKDGTIHEAVLWTSSSLQSDRRLVCKKIVQHILNRHCSIEKSAISYIGGQMDSLLHVNYVDNERWLEQGTGEEQSLAVIHAFDDVNRAVRSLTSLPLAIHSVQGTHPVFRHTEVFPAVPVSSLMHSSKVIRNHIVPEEGKTLPPYVPALKVICMLEGSGKWPEDKEAIQCMKALLHVKMGSELKEKHLLPVSISQTHVDVLKSGFVFRLVLANTREIAVLRTVKSDDGMVKFRDTEEAVVLEKETVTLPRHTHLLHGIQQEHPVFSAAVRLCKRWIASQMLWGFIREEALELILAYIFIMPYPYATPLSPMTGLLRFLHLLTTFNWQADPLMVNLNKEFTDEDFTSVPKEMTKHRSTLPCMCIATPQDKTGTKWTRSQPTESFLLRLVVLARESLKVLEAQIMSDFSSADFKMVFRPPLENFNVIIRLLKRVNLLCHQAVDNKSKLDVPAVNHETTAKTVLPVIDFDVSRTFVEDLKACFGDFAFFFYDPFGGDSIGIVWKQQSLENKQYKPSNFNYRKPLVDEKETVTLETMHASILEDIRLMGGGVVESIKKCNNE